MNRCAANHPIFGPCRREAHPDDELHAAGEPYDAHRWHAVVVSVGGRRSAGVEREHVTVAAWPADVDLGPLCEHTGLHASTCAHCKGVPDDPDLR